MEHGDYLRVTGKGEAGSRGGPSGDLYVFVNVEPHPDFERDGTSLLTEVSIDMVEAALGHEIELSTINGDHAFKIPAGTQPGEVLKVKGKGLPRRGGGRSGDLFVRVNVVIPKKLTSEQKRMLGEFK